MNSTSIQLSNHTTKPGLLEVPFRRRESEAYVELYNDKIGKLLKWLETEKEICVAHPPIEMTEALTQTKIFLEENPITLHDRNHLEKILSEFNDKHAVHVAAVRAAIRPSEGIFS